MVRGLKTVETRSWSPESRGVKLPRKILIHAAARKIEQAEVDSICASLPPALAKEVLSYEYPLGAIVGWAAFYKAEKMTSSLIELTDTEEKAFGIWEPGRFAWYSCGSQVLRSPVKCRGGQTFWHPPIEVAEQVTKQVEGDR
ncbi:MAG: hypothetical protein KatS3mg087_0525 [Patescibacteria group bacterium]|nr:MAG: hypothetical protein KatS3mg087_0525 [Patescibacteria group bacterium]